MNKYNPHIGHLCYVRVRSRERIIEVDNSFGLPTQQIIMEQDNSYSDWVFCCVGFDDTVIVCKAVHGGWHDDPLIFPRDLYDFLPVGPMVAESLGLTFNDSRD